MMKKQSIEITVSPLYEFGDSPFAAQKLRKGYYLELPMYARFTRRRQPRAAQVLIPDLGIGWGGGRFMHLHQLWG